MSMFTSPATGSTSGVRPADLENHLLIVEPHEHRTGVTTSLGTSDVIACTVHDVTAQATHTDQLFFSKVLVASLKDRIGQRVLGILSKGTAKPGQSAPWVLLDASGDAEAVAAATAYLTSQAAATLTTPTPAPAAADTSVLTPEVLAALGNLTGKA